MLRIDGMKKLSMSSKVHVWRARVHLMLGLAVAEPLRCVDMLGLLYLDPCLKLQLRNEHEQRGARCVYAGECSRPARQLDLSMSSLVLSWPAHYLGVLRRELWPAVCVGLARCVHNDR